LYEADFVIELLLTVGWQPAFTASYYNKKIWPATLKTILKTTKTL